MATKPTLYPEWATDNIQQSIDINDDQINELLDNKIEPTPTWKSTGQLYQENLPYPYFNYNFNLINEWVTHLDQRNPVGTVITIAASANDTAATVSTRMGGTWVARGIDFALGTATVDVFERTA